MSATASRAAPPTGAPHSEYVCTTCSERKRRAPGRLPAIRRYLSPRIRFVGRESRRLGRPLLILSGRFGLLGPEDRIPWYDHSLSLDEVEALLPKVIEGLSVRHVTGILFYARPRSAPGWRPYHALLERACRARGIPMRVRRLGPEWR